MTDTRCCAISDAKTISYSKQFTNNCDKLNVFDWLKNLPQSENTTDIVEVRFKNTRKGYFRNIDNIRLKKGDIVAVEVSHGHDIGIVSLTGDLVLEQIKKNDISLESTDIKKIYRKAKLLDIKKWKEAIDLEIPTMFKARKLAEDLKLDMKIGDVEFQGDKTKAIFYYIAEERVDFRELIKIFANVFKVRIEMRQIGARQEAGRIGGIGSCGNELCCTTWISKFVSITTNSARYQELSLNPQKLAGQCGKLKCCLNFEIECYLDARKDFPDTSIPLETTDGKAFHQKTDVFKRTMWYSLAESQQTGEMNLIPLSIDRVKEIIEINKNGKSVESLVKQEDTKEHSFVK